MRQARKRSLSRRPPYQVGFSITLTVFLCLIGLWGFERIYFLSNIVVFAAHDTIEMRTVLFGESDTLGPWEISGWILAGLLCAQLFHIWRMRHQRMAWRDLILSSINISMISMFGFIFLSSWAFYYADQPGAKEINKVALISKSDFYPETDLIFERFPKSLGWVKIDSHTHINEEIGVIVKDEFLYKNLPLNVQLANHEARETGKTLEDLREGRRAEHYYDLQGRLITINESDIYARVKAKLETAKLNPSPITPYELYNAIYYHHLGMKDRRFVSADDVLNMLQTSQSLGEEQSINAANSSQE